MEVWKAKDEVMNTVRDLIAKHHPHLAAVDKEIAVVFREKATAVGDRVVLGKTSKAPSLLGVLGDTDWKFILTLAADEWTRLSEAERIALLDHHLCGCRVVEDEKTQNIKHFVMPPDVAFYREEVERHGFWRTGGTVPEANLITDLFGVKEDN